MSSTHSGPAPAWRAAVADPRTWLVLLLLSVAVYRLLLTDRGHFFWGDEQRYMVAELAVDDLLEGDYHAAFRRPYTCLGRPGFVYISAVPVLIQRAVAALSGVEPGTLRYYDAASAFNVLVSLGVAVCVFGLARTWTGSGWHALLTTLVYSLLCSSNVWIRHLMPYPASLLMFLAALWLLSRNETGKKRSRRNIVMAGALTACGHATYPGYYAFVMINLIVVLTPSERWRSLRLFGSAAAAVVAVLEALARFGATSYVGEVLNAAGFYGRHIQGWPTEGFVFAWRYLREVEGPVGMVLMLLLTVLLARHLAGRSPSISNVTRAALVAAAGGYLLHAALGVVTGRSAFYGRTLCMYMPFLVGAAVLATVGLGRPLRRLASCGIAAASCWSFGAYAGDYLRLVYPADLLAGTMAELGRSVRYPPHALLAGEGSVPETSIGEVDRHLVMVADTSPQGSGRELRLASHSKALDRSPRFVGVNFVAPVYVRERDDRFQVPDGYRLIAEATHPSAFPATGFELQRPWERRRLRERRYTTRLYELDGRKPETTYSGLHSGGEAPAGKRVSTTDLLPTDPNGHELPLVPRTGFPR